MNISIKVIAKVIYNQKKTFNRNVAPFDIALLKLEKPLEFNDWVQPIDLPMRDSSVEGKVILSGWGSTNSHGMTQPNTLMYVDLPIVDLDTCKESIESLTGPSPIHPNNICTGPLTGGVSACSVSTFFFFFFSF